MLLQELAANKGTEDVLKNLFLGGKYVVRQRKYKFLSEAIGNTPPRVITKSWDVTGISKYVYSDVIEAEVKRTFDKMKEEAGSTAQILIRIEVFSPKEVNEISPNEIKRRNTGSSSSSFKNCNAYC